MHAEIKSATLVTPSAEKIDFPANNYQVLGDMTSVAGNETRKEWINDKLAGEYDYEISVGHAKRLLDRARYESDQASNMPIETGNHSSRAKALARHKTIMDRIVTTFGEEAIAEVYSLENAQLDIRRRGVNTQRYWGESATKLFDQLITATPLVDDGLPADETPPALRPDAKLEDYDLYLRQKGFIADDLLDNLSLSGPSLELEIPMGQSLSIPTKNIVSASSFSNWAGRGNLMKSANEPGGESQSSLAVIKDFAERSTDLPPAVMKAFIQPNGVVLFVTGDSHRVAAAIARGQEEVAIGGRLSIKRLPYDMFPLP